MNETDQLVGRLRELALASPAAIVAGVSADLRRELLVAFADDVAGALREAESHAAELVSGLAERPGPWAFASAAAKARQAAGPENRQRWTDGFRRHAEIAHELSRLLAAAGALVEVLAAAEAATGGA